MKKLSVLLSILMVLSIILTMVGCSSENPVDDTTSSTETSTEENVNLPEALSNIVKADVPALANTNWELSGGMIDGVEMEEEDLQNILTNFGGRMDFVFVDGEKVQLSNGEYALESTYKASESNVLYMDFNEYKYHAVFTDIQGNNVMIVANETEPNSALYFLQIQEG